MRIPKIGDIVLYHNEKYGSEPFPAIVQALFRDCDNAFSIVAFMPALTTIFLAVNRSTSIKEGRHDYWSWSEEENPRGPHCGKCGNSVKYNTKWFETKDSVYCENCPENKENPKECEHESIWHNHLSSCAKCKEKWVPIYNKGCSAHDKAEELIDEIWKILCEGRATPATKNMDIYDLINEYKGISHA